MWVFLCVKRCSFNRFGDYRKNYIYLEVFSSKYNCNSSINYIDDIGTSNVIIQSHRMVKLQCKCLVSLSLIKKKKRIISFSSILHGGIMYKRFDTSRNYPSICMIFNMPLFSVAPLATKIRHCLLICQQIHSPNYMFRDHLALKPFKLMVCADFMPPQGLIMFCSFWAFINTA